MKKLLVAFIAAGLCACVTERDGIRYDDTIGTPGGYKELCSREPTAPECGGEQE